MSPQPIYQQPSPQRSGLLAALVAGSIIALVATNIYLYVQLDHVRTDVAKVRESLSTELSNLKDASSVTTASQSRHLETLKQELDAARVKNRDEARTMSSQAKAEAQAHADQLARQIQNHVVPRECLKACRPNLDPVRSRREKLKQILACGVGLGCGLNPGPRIDERDLRAGNDGTARVCDYPANAGGVGLPGKRWRHSNQKNKQKRDWAYTRRHDGRDYITGKIP